MFKLYPVERPYWSFVDYGSLLEITRRIHPATVLEFGPGSSTLALIEGGAGCVHTCEDNPEWMGAADDLGHLVTIHRYEWTDPLAILDLDDMTFDMAFIDGPHALDRRSAVLTYCLDRCRVIVCPAELPMVRSPLVPIIERMAAERRVKVEWVSTGPWTHAMAVMTVK